jgi:hypothetical protein
LDHRRDDEPVPVLCTLNGWDPLTRDLSSWLAHRLAEDYPALRDTAAYGRGAPMALVRRHLILPIVDGLDEVPQAIRPWVIAELNRAMNADDRLIVTSRTAEYTATASAVLGAATVQPEPIRAADIVTYITTCLPGPPDKRWQALFTAIKNNGARSVEQALSSPLTLWLFRQVYIATGRDPVPLTDPVSFPDAEAITSHLLDHLVEALIAANPPARRGESHDRVSRPRHYWDPDDTKLWLGYLASHLRARGTQDLGWWQLSRAVPGWQLKLTSALLTGLVLAPILGPILHIALEFWAYPASSIRVQLLTGLIAGAGFGVVVGPGPTGEGGRPQAALLRLAIRGAFISITVGCLVGIAAWIACRYVDVGVLFGLSTGTAAGLSAVLSQRSGTLPSTTDLHFRGRAKALLRGLFRGFAFVLAAAFASELVLILMTVRGDGINVGLRYDITYTHSLVLPIGAALGIASGVTYWITPQTGFSRLGTPSSTRRAERRIFMYRWLAFGAFATLVPGLMLAAKVYGPENHLENGLTFGLVCGMSAGLAAGLSGEWPAFVASRIVLAVRGRLPIRLSLFLDDAHRLGILRQSGPVYQFRHAALLNHAADGYLANRDTAQERSTSYAVPDISTHSSQPIA